ncbi:FidL-like protein [Pseudocitrobacter cyperus]|uniref:FidL-like protein n=1 Tax=Pseudocitrobacter cyperus TaxID=3112843 RepID=A0ABV0HRJ9_9ENTR
MINMRLISIVLLAINIIVLTALFVVRLPGPEYFNATCRAYMDYRGVTAGDGFNFKGDISFFFNDNKTGRYYISGTMSDDIGNYSISRLINFTYQHKGKEEYSFTPVSVEKSVHDDVSDKIHDKLKRMLPLTQKVTVNMSVSDNYILFSNAVSPLFICVSL